MFGSVMIDGVSYSPVTSLALVYVGTLYGPLIGLSGILNSMNNIVIVRDDSIPAPIDYLQPKAALADYFATITKIQSQ